MRRADGSPIRVLVVDDEPTLTDLLSMALRYEGWEVKTAADGRQAISLAREFKPDAIVLDIMLPDIDGLQVLSRVRADGAETPVLFLTAKDSLDDRITGLTAGGDDYVTKPFSLEELVARLRGLIRRSIVSITDENDPVIVVGDLVARRGQPRGQPQRGADRADRHRVRAAALPHAQPAPRAQQGADPRPGLEL